MADQDDDFDVMMDGVVSTEVLQGWLEPILSDLNEEKRLGLYIKIQSHGPTSQKDLCYLEQRHIEEVLPALRASRFIHDLKALLADKNKRFNCLVSNKQVFKFNRALMTKEVQKICTSNTPPSDKDIRTVVKLLGPFCRDTRPPKEHMTTYVFGVTLDFVKEFRILMDMTAEGDVVNEGNQTLYKQVYAWVDNHSRPDKDSESAPKRRKTAEKKPKVKLDAPPVVNFEEAMAAKEQLKEIYKLGRCDGVLMRHLLNQSYALQRSEINQYTQNPGATKKIWEEWGVLFHPVGAAVHFIAGCEKDPNKPLDNFLREDLLTLKYFLIHKCGAPIVKLCIASQAAMSEERDPRPLHIILILQMLAMFFTEAIDQLIVIVKDNVQIAEEGEKMQEVPLTPCLVGQGTNASLCTDFYLLIEGIRVYGPCSALAGVRVLFPIHFILGIAYNEKLKKSCQFYERVIMGYNSTDVPMGSAALKAMKAFQKFKSEIE